MSLDADQTRQSLNAKPPTEAAFSRLAAARKGGASPQLAVAGSQFQRAAAAFNPMKHAIEDDSTMRIEAEIHVHYYVEEANGQALAAIKSALSNLSEKATQTMSVLDNLKAAVAANKSGIASGISLLQGIKAALDAAIANGNDPVALQALSDQLGADDADLAAAVLANTPTPVTPPATPATTTTALASSMNPAPDGVIVTLSATVSGKAPTGTVAFLDGTTSLGAVALASGVATLDAGFDVANSPHSLTAEYSGDAANAASASSAVSQVAQ